MKNTNIRMSICRMSMDSENPIQSRIRTAFFRSIAKREKVTINEAKAMRALA